MNDERKKAIGVFDSGVGGLTVVHEIMKRLPGETIVYFGDTARVPYGSKSPDTVRRFASENIEFLKTKDVKLLVVACNTASSIALPGLREKEDIPITGVLLPGARAAARATRNKRIAVIGTAATIRSRAYEQAIYDIDPSLEIRSHPCPLLVSLAEEGWLEDEVTEMVIRRYLRPLAGFKADTLVLGCTHYPLLRNVISKVAGESVVLVDSASETAIEIEKTLRERDLLNDAEGEGAFECFVSDTPYLFKEVGEKFLGKPIGRVEHVGKESDGKGWRTDGG
ncbi:MAG: glutamate racemase [Candidatus Krumholzibacteriota bacterium]|nr:glutamate racemase [Candidatus Krumholzibacteriota bacterium]